MRRARNAVPFIGAVIVVLGAIGLLGFSRSLNPIDAILGRGPMVEVPDVTGRTRPRAIADLKVAGLTAKFTETFSLTIPRGAVARTTPRAGAALRSGSEVLVAVSKGLNSAVMPNAVGRPVKEITGPLRAAGISVKVRRVWNDAPKNQVLTQDPEPGVVVKGRDVVTLRVSRGPKPRKVPQVEGLTTAGAGYLIGKAGLTVGTITFVDSPRVAVGAVAATRPAIGTEVARDAPIDVLVSSGPTPVPMPELANVPETAAIDTLKSDGFVVAIQTRLVATGLPGVGTVLAQSPAAGTLVRPGELVVVTVGRAPVPFVTTTTTSTTLPPTTLPPVTPPTVVTTVPPTTRPTSTTTSSTTTSTLVPRG